MLVSYVDVYLLDFSVTREPLMYVRKPTEAAIHEFLQQQGRHELTYSDIGATFGDPPEGYVVDHVRIELGRGESVFQTARAAVQQWQQFELGWVQAVPPETPIAEGETVAILAHVYGLWWLNAVQIVRVVDEAAPMRFGFAYGTLPQHVGSGEERFLLEMDQNDRVWYDIRAFSKPNQLLAKLGYRCVRRMQKRFGKQSAQQMLRRAEA